MDTAKPLSSKGWFIQTLGEFVGTAMFLYLAVGGATAVVQGIGMGPSILATSTSFGMALTVTAWAFFRISGAHFNPAISFSSLITGHIPFPKFVLFFIAQLLGAMVGVGLVCGTTPDAVGQVNSLMSGESIVRGFFLEFFLTTILCFVYHMTVHERNRSTFLAALPYGFALFSCHLFATRYTNAAINPAQAFATAVVSRSFAREHWIYWFGPLCGSILAAALHILFRYMDYDQYSAGIDADYPSQYARTRDGLPLHHDGVGTATHPSGVHNNIHGTTAGTNTTGGG
ncbi:hypothetical protein BGZ65_008868, partial [Modicella reniformis]